MDSQKYDEAIRHYSELLTLHPSNASDVLYKRSKARALRNSWKVALIDAEKVWFMSYYDGKGPQCCVQFRSLNLNQRPTKDTSGSMLRYMARSVTAKHSRHSKRCSSGLSNRLILKFAVGHFINPHRRNILISFPIVELRNQYVDATPAIQEVIAETIRNMPRVLIDTKTGRLYDKTRQAAAFEALPVYDELRSSMTTRLDPERIQKEVKDFHRYVMFSHRWDYGEPLFQRAENISVYDLEASFANIKLQTFCRLVGALGFHWVWSDTCCIDKKDNVVLQESLVAMFTWYRGSSLTIVYLRGVWSHSQQPGDLRQSIWNTRAWTYQEYVAAEVVQFYTEDWKPYLGLEISNHKQDPVIIREMQQAAGALTQELTVLRPGLDRVREKLYLASRRRTTLVEDIAYSLLGIFNVSIPVIYGEGNRAVGRFLEHILAGSGDATILAWTGRAGGYNSCLPPDLTVYDQLVPPHVPQPIDAYEIDRMIVRFHSSLPDFSLAVALYDHLYKLPSPTFTASRLGLPCITFSVTRLDDASESGSWTGPRLHRAATSVLGEVEIKTRDDLSRMKGLLLIHPWISSILNQEFSYGSVVLDRTTRALRLIARLRQPFGALLLEMVAHARYRRVAADCLIMAQVREETSLTELIDGITMVDIQ